MQPKFYLLILDSLYNKTFFKLLAKILNNHWDFFSYYSLWPAVIIQNKMKDISTELDQIQIDENEQYEDLINHPRFQSFVNASCESLTAETLSPIFCRYIELIKTISPVVYQKLFYQSFRKLIEFSVEDIKNDGATHVAIIAGDTSSFMQNGKEKEHLNLFQKALQFFLLDKNIYVYPFSLMEIYAGLRNDAFYQRTLTKNENPELSLERARQVYALNKLTLLYNKIKEIVKDLLQHWHLKYQTKEIKLNFIADWLNVLNALDLAVSPCPLSVPNNILITLTHSQDGFSPIEIASFRGKEISTKKTDIVSKESFFSKLSIKSRSPDENLTTECKRINF